MVATTGSGYSEMDPKQFYNDSVPVSISLKDVPNDLADALRDQAKQNHRSVQGELMHILETAVRPRPFRALALMREIEKLGFTTPANGTDIIRKARDRR